MGFVILDERVLGGIYDLYESYWACWAFCKVCKVDLIRVCNSAILVFGSASIVNGTCNPTYKISCSCKQGFAARLQG